MIGVKLHVKAIALRTAIGGRLMASGMRYQSSVFCTRCTCTLLSGTVRDLRNGQLQHEPGQPIRICVSVPQGDVVVDL